MNCFTVRKWTLHKFNFKEKMGENVTFVPEKKHKHLTYLLNFLCLDPFSLVASPKGVDVGKSYTAGKLKELRKTNPPEHVHSSRNSYLVLLSLPPSFLKVHFLGESKSGFLKPETDFAFYY